MHIRIPGQKLSFAGMGRLLRVGHQDDEGAVQQVRGSPLHHRLSEVRGNVVHGDPVTRSSTCMYVSESSSLCIYYYIVLKDGTPAQWGRGRQKT